MLRGENDLGSTCEKWLMKLNFYNNTVDLSVGLQGQSFKILFNLSGIPLSGYGGDFNHVYEWKLLPRSSFGDR